MAISLKRTSTFCEGLDHPECVTVHPDGSLWAGGEAGQIYRISPDGKTVEEVARTGGFVLGLAVSPDGSWLAACDLKKQCVWRLDLATGQLSEFARGAGRKEPFRIPNHLVFQRDGTLFVSDSGGFREVSGKVFRFEAGDGLEAKGEVWHHGPFNFANGVALDPAEEALYVVCSWLPGVERLEIRADGSAGKRQVYARFPKTCPDGLTFDAKGNLYVSCYAPSRIYRTSPTRQVEVWLDDWEAHTLSNPTNLVFGGPSINQLFVANLGRWHILRIDAGVKGAPLACLAVPPSEPKPAVPRRSPKTRG